MGRGERWDGYEYAMNMKSSRCGKGKYLLLPGITWAVAIAFTMMELGQLRGWSITAGDGKSGNPIPQIATPLTTPFRSFQVYFAEDDNIRNLGEMYDDENLYVHVVSITCGKQRLLEVVDFVGSVATRGIEHHPGSPTVVLHLWSDYTDLLFKALRGAQPLIPTSSFGNMVVILRWIPDKTAHASRNFKQSKWLQTSEWYKCADFKLSLSEQQWDDGGNKLPSKVLVLDTDVVVLAPLARFWNYTCQVYRNKPSVLFLASKEEMEIAQDGGLSYQHHPHPYNTSGLNSGILAFPLQRQHDMNFGGRVVKAIKYAETHNIEFRYSDQCVLNLMANLTAGIWEELPCNWNVRSENLQHCLPTLLKEGGILHGSRHALMHPEDEDDNFRQRAAEGKHGSVWHTLVKYAAIGFDPVMSIAPSVDLKPP